LRSVQQTSELSKLERQLLEAQAAMARLIAEVNNQDEINLPDEIFLHAEEESVKSIIIGQRNILASLRALNSDKRSVLQSKIAQAKEEIFGLTGQIKAKRRQRSYIEKELERTLEAITKNLLPQTKAFSLHERLAEVDGEISDYLSKKTKLEQNIDELSLQISEAKAQYFADIAEQLRKQRALVFDLSQKIISARDILHRTKIVSPIDGIVVNLQVHTQNGVVTAGKPILEIVPIDDEFVVHAFVNPEDIDEVRAGMSADVRLTSVNRRQRLPMSGIVTDVSADRLTSNGSGQDYYLARIELDPEVYASEKNDLIPGMGADVFILTGSRTPLDYLLSPIAKSLQLGMREH
jgi:HlyD family type I secretion membrane fusion protein